MSSSAVKRKLSGSTNGKAIKVVQTGTLGDSFVITWTLTVG
jgi:Fe2+ transport system protein FeoA